MRYTLTFLLAGFLLIPALHAQEVRRHPDPGTSLEARWDWGLQQIRPQQTAWIGYSIRRLMHARSFTGSWSTHHRRTSLHEVVYGVPLSEPSPQKHWDSPDPADSDALLLKDMALLYRFDGTRLTDVKISNMTLAVDLEGHPLLWLGTAADAPSLALVEQRYAAARTDDLREALVSAAGLHDGAAHTVPFLSDVLQGEAGREVRKGAAFWLSQQGDPQVLPLLIRTAQADRDQEVRKQAVFAVSQVGTEAATEALIDLAQRAGDHRAREKAIFWLAQAASEKAVAALTDIVYDDEETEIQEQAVFALSRLEGEGVPLLIEVARTHPNPKVREQAIFWLGQSKDERAFEAIVQIVRGDG